MDKLYKVTTEGDCEGRSTMTLGYCTGDPSDIKKFFDNQKTYEIRLEEITVRHITNRSAKEREELLNKKKELEEQLESIKRRL
jgi:hypothetical protein